MNIEKYKYSFLLLLILILCASFYSCADEGSTVNNISNSLKGVFILYEGSSVNTDYAYYDVSTGNLTNDVFRTVNNGQTLGFNPGDMRIHSNRELYITCRGTTSVSGGIYKINAETNVLITSLQFGINPYGFVINNSEILVANIGSNYVTKLNTSLNLIRDSILTGPLPSNILNAFNKYIVCKSSLTNELSLASINQINNNVTRIFFDFTPVSSDYNYYGYFISSYTRKTIFRLDPDDFHKIDSIFLPSQYGYIGDIFKKSATSFLVVAGSKEIWQVDISTIGVLTSTLKIAQSNDITITGSAYEVTRNEIYIADNNNGISNGEMHIFDAANGIHKSTVPLGGRNPVRFAFKY